MLQQDPAHLKNVLIMPVDCYSLIAAICSSKERNFSKFFDVSKSKNVYHYFKDVSFNNIEIVAFPVYMKSKLHFFLFVLDFSLKQMSVMDSLPSWSSKHEYRTVGKNLQAYFEAENKYQDEHER